MVPLALATPGLAQTVPTPTISSLTPANGPAGTVVTVQGTGCTVATGAAPASVDILLAGPTLPSSGQTTTTSATGVSGDFSGSVTIPGGAAAGDTYSIAARCRTTAGTGTYGTASTFSVIAGSPLTGVVTTATGGVTGTGLTSTSGATTAGATSAGTTGTTGTTTSVATPITATPSFTG
jgi:hypothetical protein